MRFEEDRLKMSAADLVGFLDCKHLASLDMSVARGERRAPKIWDPTLEVLRERGFRHEQDYLAHLEASGLALDRIDGVGIDDASLTATIDSMRKGSQVIVQAALGRGVWTGRADVLLRVDTPSALGAWSYEVVDTKLARETKGATILQLSLYSWMVSTIQETEPDAMHVIAPWTGFVPESWRVGDFAAYLRRVRANIEELVERDGGMQSYPEPNLHCDVCHWRNDCDEQRRLDDHLSLVANITNSQRAELVEHHVETVAKLATLPLPLDWKPTRGSAANLTRVREQARVQIESREAGYIRFEPLEVKSGLGFLNLPEPNAGDVFLDFEGDPFVGEGGLEYLLGFHFQSSPDAWDYRGLWALDRESERRAFEKFIDFMMDRLRIHAGCHIYHYGGYESGALKRLAGRYATREEELDRLLRGDVLVDLLSVVRQGLRIGVESYSIKRLEPLYGFVRDAGLPDANLALRRVETSLELGEEVKADAAKIVETYNRDDCISTMHLRDWLELQRSVLFEGGADLPRPQAPAADPGEKVSEWLERITPLIEHLTEGVPADVEGRTEAQQGRWLLANLLDWHRREEKSGWWEYFRLAALPAEDLLDERAGVSGLQFVGPVGGTAKCPVHRYLFPAQEMDVRPGKKLKQVGGSDLGEIVDVSSEDMTIDIKKRQDTADTHPEAVFIHEMVGSQPMQESLVRLAEYVIANGIEGSGEFRAARDLLLRRPPAEFGGGPTQGAEEETLTAAIRICGQLAEGVLPIQGPPGTGKTFTGAHMICEFVRVGRKVGIVANSHAVIRNLVDKVREVAAEQGLDLTCIQKPKEKEPSADRLRIAKSNDDLLQGLSSDCHVGAGTAWLWSTPAAFEALDVLFVDEAAQMSLANVLAVAQSSKAVVLLGDPQQLDQPTQGTHPDGTGVSALEHILGGAATIQPEQGLFLSKTWRLHPSLCRFTSEVFYEGRLESQAGNENQTIEASAGFGEHGLRLILVDHHGNLNCSHEEAVVVSTIVDKALQSAATWIDRKNDEKALAPPDILVITPYNAQVFEIQKRIPGVKVGTVDKFQGQEAAVAIYSLATSSSTEAPRGMEFLYSLNRLNVATSRGKCVSVLVAAPGALRFECRSPRQMQLANAFCRYGELSSAVL